MSHSQFKLFKGKARAIATITKEIESFVTTNQLSARSIGIEFIEHTQEFLISLGYTKGSDHSAISIDLINFGKVNLEDTAGLEKKMSEAAETQKNVICHELCITDKDEFLMIFMSTK